MCDQLNGIILHRYSAKTSKGGIPYKEPTILVSDLCENACVLVYCTL